MRQSTLVFIFNKQKQILLAMKKRGFGAWKWNGAGGKLEIWESIIDAAIREVFEETGIRLVANSLIKSASLHFYFSENPEWNQEVTVFLSHDYDGEFIETDEMKPGWFNIENIPYETMWEDDIYWLPRVIHGEIVEFEFYFWADQRLEKFFEIKKLT